MLRAFCLPRTGTVGIFSVEFIDKNDGGPGLRLKKRQQKKRT
jgi:hypothetical protein